MKTYNSFNQLIEGQAALHSDMSVFNEAMPEANRKVFDQDTQKVAIALEGMISMIGGYRKSNPKLQDLHARLSDIKVALSKISVDFASAGCFEQDMSTFNVSGDINAFATSLNNALAELWKVRSKVKFSEKEAGVKKLFEETLMNLDQLVDTVNRF